ncbi:MAG TPA: TAXI family TRAP transporter solute-binding subunit [Chloroflexota bacterium]
MAEKVSGNEARGVMLTQMGLAMMASRWEGARDILVTVGDATGEAFQPQLKIATGLIGLAHAVARGEVDAAFVNPSGLLTQAYRGTGLFSQPLDLRIVLIYPSLDHFVCAVHPRTGIGSLADLRQKQYPLKVSVRQDPSHGTRVLLDVALAAYGMKLSDIEAWGGSVSYAGRPRTEERLRGMAGGELEALWDEGANSWLPEALQAGLRPIRLGEDAIHALEAVGWRRTSLPASRYPGLQDVSVIDFSGWPLYTRASLPDEDAYRLCDALASREAVMPWEDGTYQGLAHLGQDTPSTPRDVPLHPGAERWYREHFAMSS